MDKTTFWQWGFVYCPGDWTIFPWIHSDPLGWEFTWVMFFISRHVAGLDDIETLDKLIKEMNEDGFDDE